MNKVKNFIAISAFSLMVLALPSAVSAQWFPGGNNGPYYGGQGRDLRHVADRLKDRSRDFEKRVDNVVDRRDDRRDNRGGWGNNRGGWGNQGYYQGDLKQLAGDFRRAADHFEDKYGNGRNLRNSEDAARRLLDSATRLENAMRGMRMNNQLMGQWNSMRGDLNMVANTYGYNYNRGRNTRNGGNNRNGDWRNRIPFPLPF